MTRFLKVIICSLILVYQFVLGQAGYEELLEVGVTAQFQHVVEVIQESQLVFSGNANLEVSRPDSDTLVVLATQGKESSRNTLIIDSNKVGLVLRTLGGRISSVTSSKSTSESDLNYLRSVASVLFIYEGSWPRSYEMTTDIFGTCEMTISRNESSSLVERDLTRCSHSSTELVFSTHFLPILHLGMDLSGSHSSCIYTWKVGSRGILDNIACTDVLNISGRYSDLTLGLQVNSSISWKNTTFIERKVHEYMREATESTDLIYSPLMSEGDPIPEKDINEVLRELCLSSREHLTKKSLWTTAEMFYTLSRSKVSPVVLKYPCPTHIRRSVALSAALVGGSRLMPFVHDQMMTLLEEGEDLLPNFGHPLIALAISNLAQPKLNPTMPVDAQFFNRPENIEKYDKLIEMLLIAGPGALTGVTNLLQKLRLQSPDLFKEILLKAAPIFSPEEACEDGGTEEATRILHAVSPLSVRPPEFVASLRPCFATEDVGVQVSAMTSLGSLDCDTPGVLELQQLALESPSDPEIRIAAFKGLIDCLPRRPALIRTLKTVLDPDADNYSSQVASFVWSFLQSILISTNPNMLDLRLELEDDLDIISAPDPVLYDPRQHSRHLENLWILDPRTSVSVSLDLIWGRASAAPRSVAVSLVLSHDETPYNIGEITLRISSLELAAIDLTGVSENLRFLKKSIEELWRIKRDLDHNSVKSFIDKVISRIPADYQAIGSSIQISLSLLGLPVYHLYKAHFHTIIQNMPSIIHDLIRYDLHSEIFNLLPLLDNSVEIGTSAGVPIRIHLTGSTGLQSIVSHYSAEDGGNVDIGLSGGFLLKTSLVIGRGSHREEPDLLLIKKGVPQGNDLLSSSVSAKYSWSFDFPLSFSFDYKPQESRFKLRRPVVLPHFFWQEEKVTSISDRQLPVRSLEHCIFHDEPIHICLVVLEERTFSGKLQILNNDIFKPAFTGLKVIIPKGGYGPIVLLKKDPEEDLGRLVTSFELEIPAEGSNLKYDMNYMQHSTSTENSITLNLITPVHKYYAKGFLTYPSQQLEIGSIGLEISFDSSIYGLRADIHSQQNSKQTVVNPVVILKSPEYGEVEIIKSKYSFKENSKQALVEFSSNTVGPLTEFLNMKLSGEFNKSQREPKYDLILKEFTVDVPSYEKRLFMRGQIVYSEIGIDSSLHVIYGNEQDVRIVFSKGPSNLVPSSHIVPTQASESFAGSKFMLAITKKYAKLNSSMSFTLLGTIKEAQVELDANFQIAEDTGRIIIFSRHESFLNFKTMISVDIPNREISWGGSQEFLWLEHEYRMAFNVSWSQNAMDHVGFVCHLKIRPEETNDHNLILALNIPTQEIEIHHDFAKAVAGSYKHNLVLKLIPGRTITITTVTVAGTDPNVVTYGLSVDFKLDGWESSLRLVGTANCVSTYTSCTMNVVVAQGPDQLSEFEVKYTGAVIGISRTDIKLTVEKYLNLQSSVDIIKHLGSVKLRTAGDLISYEKHFKGEMLINWLSQEVAEANFLAIDFHDKQMTYLYNSSLSLNKDSRSILFRQELRVNEFGQTQLWAAILQAKIEEEIFNKKHFAKVVLSTPHDTYYTITGELSSENSLPSSFTGSTMFSADFGPGHNYLLSCDMLLQRKLENMDHTKGKHNQTVPTERDLLTFSSLGRLKFPTLGESKLSLKAKRTIIIEINKSRFSNTAEVRLVSETFPELGRLNAKLDHDQDGFSLSGRIWSGSRSAAIESYCVAGNESIKSSSSLSIIDPSKDWQMVKIILEGHHLGTFPWNFESAVDLVATLKHENLGSFRGLAQWTPSTTAFNLAVGSFQTYISGGQIFFKWTLSSLQSRIAWSDLRAYLDAKWAGMGRQIGFVFNFFYPDVFINNVDSVFNFELQESDFWLSPQILILKGRLTVNNIQHWIANINAKHDEKRYSLMIASIQPQSSSSINLEAVTENSGTYHGKGSVVIDANSHHAAASYRSSESARDLTILLKSSLLEEQHGYTYRIFTSRSKDAVFELDILISEGSVPPLWSHLYRFLIETIREKDERIKEITARDYYVYKENATDFFTRQFLKFNLVNGNKESVIEIVFPQLEGSPVMDGTVTWPDGNEEISSFFRLEQPDNSHIIEAKFLNADSNNPTGVSLKRFIYRQKMIKGIGHKLRAELEVSTWRDDEKSLRFSVQKLFSSIIATKGHSRKGGAVSEYYYRTLEGGVHVIQSSASSDFKVNWTTEDSTNEMAIFWDQNHAGHRGHIGFIQKSAKSPEILNHHFLLKGNFRRFASEVACSFTFEQSSLGRPRSITFLHSYPEEYSEIVLDMAKSEEDQVIMVLFTNLKEKSFKIGQLGNTFLQIGHKIVDDEENQKNPFESFMFEISGQLIKLKIGQKVSDEGCKWVGIAVGTPVMTAMYNTYKLCYQNNSELKIQMLGLEENEGPYLRIGQISEPRGLGLQIGGGRIFPIDTPPALTITGNMKEEFFEALFDWQINSMNQLLEDLHTRKLAYRKAMKKLKIFQLNVKGDIGFDGVVQEIQQLLDETTMFVKPFYEEIIASMDEKLIADTINAVESSIKWVDKKCEEVQVSIEIQLSAMKNIIKSMRANVATWVNLKAQNVQEVFDFHFKDFKELSKNYRPLWVRLTSGICAIRYNDNQSLYALTSRTMSFLHSKLGRHKGLKGFLVNDFITRLEKNVGRRLTWENVKVEIFAVVDKLEAISPINIIMFHDTAFRLQIYTPNNTWKITAEKTKKIQEIDFSGFLKDLKSFWRRLKARTIYLTTPHVRGTSVLFGWESAISWDGTFLPILMSNTCPHLLVMLTKPASKTALVLHLEGEEHLTKRVLTFISGDNEVTIDADLKIKINGASTRMEKVDFGNIQLRKSENDVRIVSSDGLILQCHLQNDGLCLLEVDKKNFAATAGLLGVFDFEANTDFMTSSWERPASELEWSSSWRVTTGENCKPVPLIRPVSRDQQENCMAMFSKQSSPFKDCLPAVNQKPYKEACRAGKECGAEQAYLKECVKRHYLDHLEASLTCDNRPRVVLELISGGNELYEGEDATFSCKSESEYHIMRTEWYKDLKLLSLTTASNLDINDGALNVHQIRPSDDGIYQCKIINSHGVSESNTLRLVVLHKPMCAQGLQTLILPEGSSMILECNMKANPPDVSFAWVLQNDVDYIQFPISRYTSDGLFSTLDYTVWTHLDFGTVYCLAENEIGQQSVACEFQISPEGECVAPIQAKGTDDLEEEIVIIGEFSCIDSIEEFVKIIKKESYRPQRIILKYLNEGTPPENIHDFDSIASISEKNIFRVLESSLNEDFSQDALKIVVLMDCHRPDCKSQENAERAARLQDTLRETGVHLYTITEDAFTITSPEDLPNKVKKQLLGIDRAKAYLMSHAKKKNLKGKKDIRRAVDTPKDNWCALLALQSNGATFSLSVLKKMKKSSHKKLFQQFIGLRVLEGHLEKYLKCRNCPCEENEPCKICKPPPPIDSSGEEQPPDQDVDYEEDFE